MYNFLFLILSCLFIKHWYFDFVNQTQEEVDLKGTYGNWTGMKHSVKHGLATAVILIVLAVDPAISIMFGLIEFFLHYHIDWIKMHYGTKDMHTKAFWTQFGFDQLAHSLTYLAITWTLFV